jgi:hypothetical protein
VVGGIGIESAVRTSLFLPTQFIYPQMMNDGWYYGWVMLCF